MLASCIVALGVLPIDNVKTKLLNQAPDLKGVLPYKSMADCAVKTVRNEGYRGLWAGLPTFYFRVGPHAIIALLMLEVYTSIFITKNKKDS